MAAVFNRKIIVESLKLSLRQRKILRILEQRASFVTSKELAESMKVSSRTIRNDIHDMDRLLAPLHVNIISIQSKGFFIDPSDSERVREIQRTETAFFSRSERIRYLVFRLCEADQPINLYDLEEEVYLSHTALLSDLKRIEKKYTYGPPYLKLVIKGDEVSFEQDEEKIRAVLLNLFHEDWDYAAQKNAFYIGSFLNLDLMKVLISETTGTLFRYGIKMDDATLTALQLLLGIMHYRVIHGHIFPEGLPLPDVSGNVGKAVVELFDLMQKQTNMTYPSSEQARINQFISETQMPEENWLREGEQTIQFPESVNEEVAKYFAEIRNVFQVDFSVDWEFDQVLRIFFLQLAKGHTMFSHYQDPIVIKNLLPVEMELAYLYQRHAMSYIGRYLSDSETCTLAVCFSGAIRQYLQIHPEKKLRAVLFSHGNPAAAFGLKRRILESFDLYLKITDVAPLNFAYTFDFSDVDIIFSTQKKKIAVSSDIATFYIDDHPGLNFENDAKDIKLLSIRKIWPVPLFSMGQLLEHAFWHEDLEGTSQFVIMEKMAEDYIQAGLAEKQQMLDILQRETVNSFAIKPGLAFVYTILPAAETRLSVCHLKHRIRWNDFKISTVVMAMFAREEINLLFHLKIRFCNQSIDPELLKKSRTKEELIRILK